MKKRKDKTGFKAVGDILKGFDREEKKYISREFQDYGYRLAEELDDLKHKALYIKLAKELPRPLLEEARNFVKDAKNVENPGKLFMWKLKQLKNEKTKELKNKRTEKLRNQKTKKRRNK